MHRVVAAVQQRTVDGEGSQLGVQVQLHRVVLFMTLKEEIHTKCVSNLKNCRTFG